MWQFIVTLKNISEVKLQQITIYCTKIWYLNRIAIYFSSYKENKSNMMMICNIESIVLDNIN